MPSEPGSTASRCVFWHAEAGGTIDGARVAANLPEGDFRRIVIKPNWVRHADPGSLSSDALVTSPAVLESVIEACLDRYPRAATITVGDVPLQSCDWRLLEQQAGIARLRSKYERYASPRIDFRDWRRERYVSAGGFLRAASGAGAGDPAGSRDVTLDERSFLEEVSGQGAKFRVSDYDPDLTVSAHRPGFHRYHVSATVLESDLFVNVPKIKTHQKAGITGALKNLVGINIGKAYLVHHRQGIDEFMPGLSPLIRLQVRTRDLLQKRSRALFALGRFIWVPLRRMAGIRTDGAPAAPGQRAYVGAGSWYGNDTVWRMIYDLNRLILHAPAGGGSLSPSVQRACVTVLDGLTAGEGDGPLRPVPVSLNLAGVSSTPFLMDMALAQMMGFNWQKIPQLANYRRFGEEAWTGWDRDQVEVELDGIRYRGIGRLPVLHRFVPPPGWRDHIESRAGEEVES